MCGIVGFITENKLKGEDARQKFLTQGLIVDTLRGTDSTGVYAVGHESLYKDLSAGTWWEKHATDGFGFTETKEYKDNFSVLTDYRAVVGHNRAATMGGYGSDSAHPFEEGPITLVHNGTLNFSDGLKTPMRQLKGVTVDSHAICHNLARHDAVDVVENLNGAFTLVWHDARDDSINIVRNDERPLHMGVGQNGKTLFFMSEASMLAMLDSRLRLGIKSIYYPKAGQLLKWGPDSSVSRPTIKELKLNQGWQGFNNSYYQNNNYNKSPDIDQSNKVTVNRSYREIPDLLQEQLLEKDMVVEDRLAFSPVLHTKTSTGFMSVLGVLENGLPARLHRVSENLVGQMKRDWLIRPLAVKGIDDNEDSPLVIVALVTTNPTNNKTYRDRKAAEREVESGTNIYQTYKGPDGRLVSSLRMNELLHGGCLWCNVELTIADVDDIVWTKDQHPVCWECTVNPGIEHIAYIHKDC